MGCPSLPWGRLDKEQSGGRGGGELDGVLAGQARGLSCVEGAGGAPPPPHGRPEWAAPAAAGAGSPCPSSASSRSAHVPGPPPPRGPFSHSSRVTRGRTPARRTRASCWKWSRCERCFSRDPTAPSSAREPRPCRITVRPAREAPPPPLQEDGARPGLDPPGTAGLRGGPCCFQSSGTVACLGPGGAGGGRLPLWLLVTLSQPPGFSTFTHQRFSRVGDEGEGEGRRFRKLLARSPCGQK